MSQIRKFTTIYMTTKMIVESGTYKFIKNQKKNVTNPIFFDYIIEKDFNQDVRLLITA